MAQVALDTTTQAVTSGGAKASLTWSHTCTGSNLILIVFVGYGSFNSTRDDFSVTYNGVSMTHITTANSTNSLISAFYLINPASGAHNVVATPSTNNQVFAGIAHSYTNALQSGQPDSSSTGTGSGTDYTATTTVVSQDCWAIIGAVRSASGYTGGASTTLRQSAADANGFSTGSGDSNGSVATGSVALHLTGTSGGEQSTIVLSINNIPTAYTLTADQQSYTQTTFTANFFVAHTLTCTQASYVETTFAATLTPFYLWVNGTKDSTSFTNGTKAALPSWNNGTKDTTAFVNQSKSN